jgi:hypothetical protein
MGAGDPVNGENASVYEEPTGRLRWLQPTG